MTMTIDDYAGVEVEVAAAWLLLSGPDRTDEDHKALDEILTRYGYTLEGLRKPPDYLEDANDS